MSNPSDRMSIPDSEIALQALLYANGLLSASECDAFERSLGESQRTRDFLTAAVGQLFLGDNQQPLRPSPKYRLKIRKKLADQRSARLNQNPNPKYVFQKAMIRPMIAVAACLMLFLAYRYVTSPLSPNSKAKLAQVPRRNPGLLFSTTAPHPLEEQHVQLFHEHFPNGFRVPMPPEFCKPLAMQKHSLVHFEEIIQNNLRAHILLNQPQPCSSKVQIQQYKLTFLWSAEVLQQIRLPRETAEFPSL